MPAIIPKPCRRPGCAKLTILPSGYCDLHQGQRTAVVQKRPRDRRPSAHRRGYGRSWNKARRLFLQDNPLCTRCFELGRIVAAAVVDHIEPHRGDRMKFWDRDNWQALCKRCHDRKTGSEDRAPGWY